MSRACFPASDLVPPEIFRLVTQARMSFSEPLVLSGTSGRSRTTSSSALLACRRANRRSRVVNPVLVVNRASKRRLDRDRRFRVGFSR